MIRDVLNKYSSLVGWGLLATFLSLMLVARLEAREAHSLYVPPPGTTYHLPSERFARFSTLGYHEAAADLAWLRAIIYFGEQATISGRFEHFTRYADLVVELDPNFRRIYHWAGVLCVYSSAVIKRQMVEDSIRYLKEGTERFPGDGEMHYMLGFNLYFELPPHLGGDEKAKRESKLEGIEHLKRAVVSGSGPPWLANMVAGLMSKHGMEQLALGSLYDSLAVVEDPATREKIYARIREIEEKVGASGQAVWWQSFQKEWSDSYRYLTMDQFLLVRPRPLFPPEAAVEPLLPESEKALDVLDSIEVP
jgi:hypothetical protein